MARRSGVSCEIRGVHRRGGFSLTGHDDDDVDDDGRRFVRCFDVLEDDLYGGRGRGGVGGTPTAQGGTATL